MLKKDIAYFHLKYYCLFLYREVVQRSSGKYPGRWDVYILGNFGAITSMYIYLQQTQLIAYFTLAVCTCTWVVRKNWVFSLSTAIHPCNRSLGWLILPISVQPISAQSFRWRGGKVINKFNQLIRASIMDIKPILFLRSRWKVPIACSTGEVSHRQENNRY